MAKTAAYLARATRWRCPVCGQRPIFPAVRSIRRLQDWAMPLDGCPRCGYGYEREPGYFRLVVWAFNTGFASLGGVGVFFLVAATTPLTWAGAVAAFLGPFALLNVLLVRHAKAYFIAIDHLLDPHEREGGDDRGNQRLVPPPWRPAPGGGSPEPCETGPRVR